MPSASSSLTNEASVYRGGARVLCARFSRSVQASVSPSARAGSSLSALLSAARHAPAVSEALHSISSCRYRRDGGRREETGGRREAGGQAAVAP
jgi:hypothetical protein